MRRKTFRSLGRRKNNRRKPYFRTRARLAAHFIQSFLSHLRCLPRCTNVAHRRSPSSSFVDVHQTWPTITAFVAGESPISDREFRPPKAFPPPPDFLDFCWAYDLRLGNQTENLHFFHG
ncbi:hypothetical protein MA16_Dca006604 [Dendrobium catenatum]|uniref:Uncharacterized protein n=1 Tax=Dendrobium catenatum TaxID=906689 RepID=A0A2I0X5L3_9ASPA|nr:hypothetical protein MA16_Dca006604 [Dendrobium catenatum]